LCTEGPDKKLNKTQNTQPAIFTLSMIIDKLLRENEIIPLFVAGHSLGEYSALASAGVFDLKTGVELVRKRGIIMNEADPQNKGAMAAIIGLNIEEVEEICSSTEGICEIANHNSPQQIVVTGENKSVKLVMDNARERGAKRAILLKVSGAFHSPLMKSAQLKLEKAIHKYEFNMPKACFVQNIVGKKVNKAEEIKKLLVKQLTGRVRWVNSMNFIIKQGVNIFIEVGPGRTLKGLLKRINPSVNVYTTDNNKQLIKVLSDLK
ncbi:MAG TPA: ACP S-malonyltransferase, partial [Halanaerobiales bacterium]|nr:ACP S-malonyltransferase [Halanaerobiales bacterium]